MKNLRRDMARFFYRNSDKGIPNLMLWIAIGNVIVYFFSLIDPSNVIYNLLVFDRSAILHGQIWRLFSYVFTYLLDSDGMNLLFGIISLLCYNFIGRTLEQYWGTLRFNCYYLTGIVLADILAMLVAVPATTYYLNLSLFLAIATIIPDTRFMLFYIIPVKAKYLAWFYFLLTAWDIVQTLMAVLYIGPTLSLIIFAFSPLIALLNYILFFGKDILNIMPDFLRYRATKTQREYRAKQRPDPNWSRNYQSSTGEKPYRHKCTVCGRTDVSNPELDFRYCSKCSGYYCYCMDHINNHVHIQK